MTCHPVLIKPHAWLGPWLVSVSKSSAGPSPKKLAILVVLSVLSCLYNDALPKTSSQERFSRLLHACPNFIDVRLGSKTLPLPAKRKFSKIFGHENWLPWA